MPWRANWGRPVVRRASPAARTMVNRSAASCTGLPSRLSVRPDCVSLVSIRSARPVSPRSTSSCRIAVSRSPSVWPVPVAEQARASGLPPSDSVSSSAIEAVGQRQAAVHVVAAIDAARRYVEHAHGHARIHGAGHVGGWQRRHERVGEDFGEPLAATAENVQQRLVDRALHGGGDDAQIRLPGQRDAGLHDTKVQVICLAQAVRHVGHEPRRFGIDVRAEGGVGAEVVVGLGHEAIRVGRNNLWNSGRAHRSQKLVNTGRLPTNVSPAPPNICATSAK